MESGSRVSTPVVVALIGALGVVVAAVISVAWPSRDEQPPAPGDAPPPGATTTSRPAGPAAGYGEPVTFQLELSGGVFVDLDARAVTFDGGSDFEFFYKGDVNKALYFGKDENLYGRSEVRLIPYNSAGPEACEKSNRPQKQTVSGYFMKDDDAICMSTSSGAWAVLDVLEWGGLGGRDGVMDVTLWPSTG